MSWHFYSFLFNFSPFLFLTVSYLYVMCCDLIPNPSPLLTSLPLLPSSFCSQPVPPLVPCLFFCVQVLCKQVITVVCLWLQRKCDVQKTAFYNTSAYPPGLIILPFLQQCSVILRVSDILVPFGTEYAAVLDSQDLVEVWVCFSHYPLIKWFL
jgi:hypothetical protein